MQQTEFPWLDQCGGTSLSFQDICVSMHPLPNSLGKNFSNLCKILVEHTENA